MARNVLVAQKVHVRKNIEEQFYKFMRQLVYFHSEGFKLGVLLCRKLGSPSPGLKKKKIHIYIWKA